MPNVHLGVAKGTTCNMWQVPVLADGMNDDDDDDGVPGSSEAVLRQVLSATAADASTAVTGLNKCLMLASGVLVVLLPTLADMMASASPTQPGYDVVIVSSSLS